VGEVMPIITWLGGRRFVMTMGCGLVTTLLCFFGKIDGGTYSVVICATVAAYITGNGVEKAFGTKGGE